MGLDAKIPVVSLDDLRLPVLASADSASSLHGATLDAAFTNWARIFRAQYSSEAVGVIMIHANGIFTADGRRQDLQGVDILKHIRLTPWLEQARTWHAVVYSFEPIEQILSRRPGNLILLSPGTTFLRLPDAIELDTALTRAIPVRAQAWRGLSAAEMLADLARRSPASPTIRDLRTFVAADYVPPDSAHDISNRWGIYEILRAYDDCDRGVAPGKRFPEVECPEILPPQVLHFVQSLDGKKARFLDGEVQQGGRTVDSATVEALSLLESVARGRTVAYIDDEAHVGWRRVLERLLASGRTDDSDDWLKTPAASDRSQPPTLLRNWARDVAAVVGDRTAQDGIDRRYCQDLARWVIEQQADLLILDLRLLGTQDGSRAPRDVSGMKVARAVREMAPYLPILLFTASNKAETLFASQSLAIDDFWMKPGLGEHRAVRGGSKSLQSLAKKLARLMGHDYAWLAKAGAVVEEIKGAAPNSHWWEQMIVWPSPIVVGDTTPPGLTDTYVPDDSLSDGLRKKIVALVRTALDLSRASLRITVDRDTLKGQLGPTTLAAALRAAAFNRLGQVVELIHDEDPLRFIEAVSLRGSTNSRVGGGERRDKRYVHRRNDWIAFRLFAFRNSGSHAKGAATTDKDLRSVACDALAWLSLPRHEPEPISAEDVAGLRTLIPSHHIVRMHPQDAITNGHARDHNADQHKAQTDHFRVQMGARAAFRAVLDKSDQLSGL